MMSTGHSSDTEDLNRDDSGSEGYCPDSDMTDYESIYLNLWSSYYDQYPYGTSSQMFNSATPCFALLILHASMYYTSFYPPPPKPPANDCGPASSTSYGGGFECLRMVCVSVCVCVSVSVLISVCARACV